MNNILKTEGKKRIAFILLLIMLLNLLPVGIFNHKVYAEDIATGTSGTCTWIVDGEGTLTIKPTNGQEGTLRSNDDNKYSYPWRSYRDNIKSIKIEGKVYTGSTAKNLFHGLYKLEVANLNGLYTDNTTNLVQFFNGCTSLDYIDITMLNLNKVTSMNGFFPAGMWKKEENGTEYYASQIAGGTVQKLSEIPGKYKKTASVEHGLEIKESITYKVDLNGKETEAAITGDIVQRNNSFYYEYPKEIPSTSWVITGSIEVVFKDAVVDVNNEVYDFKVTLDNMKIFNAGARSHKYLMLATLDGRSTISLCDYRCNSSFLTSGYSDKVNYDITMQVINNAGKPVDQGEFIFSAFDLDTPGSSTFNSVYTEGVMFSEGFDNYVLSDKTCLKEVESLTESGETRIRVRGTRYDDATEASMVLAVADASGFTVRWTAGNSCTTKFMSGYNPTTVKFRKIDEQGNPLAGANLSLYMKNSEEHLIESWTTTNEDKALFLNPGTYILKETATPDGSYELAEDKIIYVESDGTVAIAGEGTVEDVVVRMKNYKKSAKVIVNHYIMELDGTKTEDRVHLNNGGRPEQDFMIRGQIGESYNTQPLTEEELADEYEYVEVEGNPSGVFTEETQYVTYYYRLKQYPYTVNYYDKETGELIGPKTKQGDKQYLGTEIETEKEIIEIEEYEYDSADVESIEIVKDVDKNVINIYYIRKKGTVITKYKDIETGEEIEVGTNAEDYVDEDYETEKKEIPGYVFVKDTENTSGKYIEGKIEVVYYYKKLQKGTVVTKYIDVDTEEEIEVGTSAEDYVDEDYETEKKEIPGYVFVKDTENTQGKYINGEIEVIYYYRKLSFDLKVDKWVDTVNINGVKTKAQNYNTKDEIYKTEISERKIENGEVLVTYKIRVTNTGEIDGYVDVLSELIPEGFEFRQEDNKVKWEIDGDTLITDTFKGTKIEPGQYKEIEIVLRWKNSESNFGEKSNIVTLSKVRNEFNYEEKTTEDNQYTSKMVISLTTGLDRSDKVQITKISVYAVGGLMVLAFITNKARKRK